MGNFDGHAGQAWSRVCFIKALWLARRFQRQTSWFMFLFSGSSENLGSVEKWWLQGLGWSLGKDALTFFLLLPISFSKYICQNCKYLLAAKINTLLKVWPVYYTVCDYLSQIKSEVWNVSFLYLSCTSKCRLVPIDTLVWLLSGLSLSGQSGVFFAQGDCFRGRLESKRVLPTLFLDPPTHPPGSIWTWIGIELTWISLRILKSYN